MVRKRRARGPRPLPIKVRKKENRDIPVHDFGQTDQPSAGLQSYCWTDQWNMSMITIRQENRSPRNVPRGIELLRIRHSVADKIGNVGRLIIWLCVPCLHSTISFNEV